MPFPVSSTPFSGSSPSTAYAGTFIPEVWSGKLVEKFYKATVLGAIANTDYEGEIKNYGDKVQIRSRPTITIRDYQSDMDLAVDRPSEPKQTLNIDKGQYFNLALDDVMEIQSDIDQLSIWAEDAAEQMKITIDSDVLNGNTAGDGSGIVNNSDLETSNIGNTAGAISANYRLGTDNAPTYVNKTGRSNETGSSAANNMAVIDYIVNCGSVLDEQSLPENGRFMVIPAWLAGMIKKSDLKDASLTNDGVSILRNGRLGMIDRFTVYLSNILVPPTSYTNAYPVIFGTNAALTFASQYVNVETLRSERSFSNLLRGLQVYGWKIINPIAMGLGFVAKN